MIIGEQLPRMIPPSPKTLNPNREGDHMVDDINPASPIVKKIP